MLHSANYGILVVPLLGLVVFLFGIKWAFAIKQENNNGEKIEKYDDLIWANFKEVRCNTSIEENGKFSYVIICEWMNPLEQKSYLFTSENIWYNPEEIIHTYHLDTEPFPVYICRENLNEYRIDISVLEELKMTGK